MRTPTLRRDGAVHRHRGPAGLPQLHRRDELVKFTQRRQVIVGFGALIVLVVVIVAIAGGSDDNTSQGTPTRSTPTAQSTDSTPTPAPTRSAPAPSGPRSANISGQGDHVQAINLAEGVYYCDISVRGNSGTYGPDNFAVVFAGREGGSELLANEIESSWSARKKVTVGGGLFELDGTIDVEVTATGSWQINCSRQD